MLHFITIHFTSYRCAVGDYSTWFGKLDSSGRRIAIENTLKLKDLIGLFVCVHDRHMMTCGRISPVFGKYTQYSQEKVGVYSGASTCVY